jgi:hypothetical protein
MVASIATLAEFDGEAPPPLAPPTQCVAQYVEEMNIKITWNAPVTNTPDEYYVYRDETKIYETTELYHTDVVEDLEKHCYTVTAVYSGVESVHSNTSCVSVPPPPLDPPTNCVATWIEEAANINNNILVTWDAPTENTPDEYFVFRDEEKITQTTEIQFMDALPTPGEYCYKIKAIYGEEQSEFSNQSCAIIPHIDGVREFNSNYVLYPNPANKQLTIENGQLKIENVEIYDIYGRKVGAKFPSFQEGCRDSGGVVFDISHLTPGVYFVKINNEIAGKFVKE